MKYVIISAAKDEQKYIENTLQSVAHQKVKPVLWLIVDDGSKDNTCKIIKNFMKDHEWIRLLRTGKETERQPGTGVIRAFNFGYYQIKHKDYDFIVKLDCDLKFEPDYFEKIFRIFNSYPRLGIASGVYKEYNGRGWHVVSMPEYHAAGASKIIRKECFKQIGGFLPARGWDTVDEIRAQMFGWETRHFPDVSFYHLKNEGSGIGFLNTNAMQGEIFYLTGGSPIFFVLKCGHRMLTGKPFLLGGFFQLAGYLRAWKKKEKLVNQDEERFYRRQLNKRIVRALSKIAIKKGE